MNENERLRAKSKGFGSPHSIVVGKPDKHLKMTTKVISWRKLRNKI